MQLEEPPSEKIEMFVCIVRVMCPYLHKGVRFSKVNVICFCDMVPSLLVLKIETINDNHNEVSVACTCSEEVLNNILRSDHLLNIKHV